MLILKGTLINIFMGSEFKREDGSISPAKQKIQILTKVPLKNGGTKNELIDLSIPIEKVSKYKGKENSTIEVEVAIIGKVQYYGI